MNVIIDTEQTGFGQSGLRAFRRIPVHATIACLALVGSCLGCGSLPGSGSLPVYSFDQTDSSRAGYRRTTITSAGTVFVHDGTPTAPFTVETAAGTGNVHSLLLWSDQLPGLVFSAEVYFDPAGSVYLAENLAAVEFHGSNQSIRANWIPASASFTRWSKTGD